MNEIKAVHSRKEWSPQTLKENVQPPSPALAPQSSPVRSALSNNINVHKPEAPTKCTQAQKHGKGP
eukprot:1148822-Pelagomonas_calceolata.AAC.7